MRSQRKVILDARALHPLPLTVESVRVKRSESDTRYFVSLRDDTLGLQYKDVQVIDCKK